MATRPQGYGFSADTKRRLDSKYDVNMEIEARNWIEAITDIKFSSEAGANGFQQELKDGVTLCELINKLQPGSVKKINRTTMTFKLMENIGNFLSAIDKYGVNKMDAFQTVDLFEAQNMWSVVTCIHALGRKAQQKHFNGPTLGVKEAQGQKREFTQEQLNAGKGIIGLQMGSNEKAKQGASQSGMGYGRDINSHSKQQFAGKDVIGLQMGSNENAKQGASQAGMSYGRDIISHSGGRGSTDMESTNIEDKINKNVSEYDRSMVAGLMGDTNSSSEIDGDF